MSKIRVLIHSNSSRAVTGFGKAMKNIFLALQNDPNIELIEAANGARYGADLKTPWESYGTFPNDPSVLSQISGQPEKEKAAGYGYYTIDQIVEKVKPDVYLGVEDIWAFNEYAKKPWWGKIPCIIWTTLDSVPILLSAENLAPKCDRFLVWASFAEEEMKKKGFDNVATLHGPVDYSDFYPISSPERQKLREKYKLSDNFVVGFVFKNQLRKSAPNLLEGFKRFLDKNPKSNAKLYLHSDWSDTTHGWDLPKYVKEKGVDPERVVTTYICKNCREYTVSPYTGEEKECPCCGGEKSLVTKTVGLGVQERQLNEIYNLMDVYCHPFTSGGQELPVQEAKAAGLITLVTDYSCGTDAVGEGTGGIPLKWAEYREPYTDFIKATTDPESIKEELERVWNMSGQEKDALVKEGIKYVHDEYSVPTIVQKLKKELLAFGKTNYDFDFSRKDYNTEYSPHPHESDIDWLVDLYSGMCYKKLTPLDPEIKGGLQIIKEHNSRDKLYLFLKSKCEEKNRENNQRKTSLEDLLDDEGPEGRIAIVIPESAGDVLMVNSLIRNLNMIYPDKNIYVITKPSYFDMINDNKYVHKLIPYQDGLDNLLFLEGRGDHKGYFDIAFLPHVGTQRVLNYLHNGNNKHQFDLYETD